MKKLFLSTAMAMNRRSILNFLGLGAIFAATPALAANVLVEGEEFIDGVRSRKRAILHIEFGDENWQPTEEELEEIRKWVQSVVDNEWNKDFQTLPPWPFS